MGDLYLHAFLIGIGATAFMDLAALAQRHLLGLLPLDYAMVGRWLGHLIRGRVIHRPIMASSYVRGELMIGWAAHYLIGILFAIIFLACSGEGWDEAPSPGPALVFGGLTVLAPFLILQPGMGAGLAARNTPNPNTTRLKSFVAHLSFGAGLWLAGVLVSSLV